LRLIVRPHCRRRLCKRHNRHSCPARKLTFLYCGKCLCRRFPENFPWNRNPWRQYRICMMIFRRWSPRFALFRRKHRRRAERRKSPAAFYPKPAAKPGSLETLCSEYPWRRETAPAGHRRMIFCRRQLRYCRRYRRTGRNSCSSPERAKPPMRNDKFCLNCRISRPLM